MKKVFLMLAFAGLVGSVSAAVKSTGDDDKNKGKKECKKEGAACCKSKTAEGKACAAGEKKVEGKACVAGEKKACCKSKEAGAVKATTPAETK